MNDPRLRGMYAILDADAYGESIYTAAQQLIAGGIRLFQYRAKNGVAISVVQDLHQITQKHAALLFVNDDYHAAVHADGLHIGQDDLDSAALAHYRTIRPSGIVGISAHLASQLASAPGADYFGIGPLRATQSKEIARSALGISGLAILATAAAQPVCAIGGITLDDLPALAAANIAMVACIGAFAAAPDRRATAAEYVRTWQIQRNHA